MRVYVSPFSLIGAGAVLGIINFAILKKGVTFHTRDLQIAWRRRLSDLQIRWGRKKNSMERVLHLDPLFE